MRVSSSTRYSPIRPSLRVGERALARGDFEILAVGRGSGLLPPGVVQIACVDGIEAEIVDRVWSRAGHCCARVRPH
jgi:hypothetical protein